MIHVRVHMRDGSVVDACSVERFSGAEIQQEFEEVRTEFGEPDEMELVPGPGELIHMVLVERDLLDFLGAAPDLTGGLSTDDFMSKIRPDD